MARTKVTPWKERGGERWVLWPRAWRTIAEKGRRPPSLVHHPSPAKKPSPAREEEKRLEEAERQVEEARQVEDVGRSPSSLPTWQLAQMAAEAESSALGQEEALTYHGRQSPLEGIPSGWESKEHQGSTGLEQLLFKRSGSSRRALNSSLGNSPSCS